MCNAEYIIHLVIILVAVGIVGWFLGGLLSK
jgi:hypothetical protein